MKPRFSPPPAPTLYRLFLTLCTLEGLPALFALFGTPSESDRAFLFGFSASRVALGGLALLLLTTLGVLTLKALLDRPWLERTATRLALLLSPGDRLLHLIVALAFLTLAGVGLMVFFASPLSEHADTSRAIFGRAAGLFAWGVAVLAQGLGAVGLAFWGRLHEPGFFARGKVLRAVLAPPPRFPAGVQGGVLFFREAVFTALDGWFWQFHPKGFGARDVVFVAMAAAVGAWIAFRVRNPQRVRASLGLLLVLGYVLQIGVGIVEGSGVESLRVKYVETPYVKYASHASDNADPLAVLTDYENTYARFIFLETKPPGTLLLYALVQEAVGAVDAEGGGPEATHDARLLRLTTAAAYAFPFVAVLGVAPLAWLSRRVFPQADPLLPGLFYLLCPNAILITLLLDQVLFPLLFVGGLGLCWLAIRRGSFWLAAAAGGFVYLAVYFTFSLLPLGFFAAAWVGAHFWMHQREQSWQAPLKLWAGLALGFVALLMVFQVALHYDFLARYQVALAEHRTFKRVSTGGNDVLRGLLINNLEFAWWMGFPMTLLFLAGAAQTALALWRGKARRAGGLLAAFGATYLVLNLLGQTISEVGRLWLFLVPLVALFAAPLAVKLFANKAAGVYLVAALQMLTLFLMYKFQDFY